MATAVSTSSHPTAAAAETLAAAGAGAVGSSLQRRCAVDGARVGGVAAPRRGRVVAMAGVGMAGAVGGLGRRAWRGRRAPAVNDPDSAAATELPDDDDKAAILKKAMALAAEDDVEFVDDAELAALEELDAAAGGVWEDDEDEDEEGLAVAKAVAAKAFDWVSASGGEEEEGSGSYDEAEEGAEGEEGEEGEDDEEGSGSYEDEEGEEEGDEVGLNKLRIQLEPTALNRLVSLTTLEPTK